MKVGVAAKIDWNLIYPYYMSELHHCKNRNVDMIILMLYLMKYFSSGGGGKGDDCGGIILHI